MLANPKHEQFAQLVATGSSQTEAYQQAYPDSSKDAARACASRLLTCASVQARKAEIQGKVMAKFLTIDRKRTILAEIGEGQRPSRRVVLADGSEEQVFEPVKAIELDAKLAGELDGRSSDPNGGLVSITLIGCQLNAGLLPVAEPEAIRGTLDLSDSGQKPG